MLKACGITYVKRFYFPVFVIIALVVYTLQRFSVALPSLINNYLNDLLCMPIVLKIAQLAVRYLKKDGSIQLPIALVGILALGYACYFEWFLPQFNSRYTADGIDVFLYFMGALFFVVVERYNRYFSRE
ncbi:hypothetical protein EJ994_04730 [Maribacter sp. MJ134]|uniref:hypothetical protein n=1 Tax=Maribacter sp. MJ134 TaxID=2496865 RepID=UPI000F831D6F|nr:hypothetical protein [Maribacter sp. MJ134]AZQ58145.1 hypothetical protein EJ994_04730 [Maribacter sp. MJ134]